MAQTISAEIHLEPDEFGRLEELARQQDTSIEALIRQAVRERFFHTQEQIDHNISQILNMEVPIVLSEAWESIESELMEAHHKPLP